MKIASSSPASCRWTATAPSSSYEVCEGVIRSARRMTYTQVHAILTGDEATRAEFARARP